MSKMMEDAMTMFTNIFEIIDSAPTKIEDYKVKIDCATCKAISEVTIGAICKQKERGHVKFRCSSCSGKSGWTQQKREEARKHSKLHWQNPKYSGSIIGKAVAREIISGTKKRRKRNG